MQNLTVIENDLVPVYETSAGEKVVYGTELHDVLEVKSNYRDWIKNRLNDCEAVENEDFESFAKNLAKGRPSLEHIIKLDTAKEMECSNATRKASRYADTSFRLKRNTKKIHWLICHRNFGQLL